VSEAGGGVTPRDIGQTGDLAGNAADAAGRLVDHSAELWPRVTTHPFVQAVADGSLDRAAFERWMVADHTFNIEHRRFLAGLIAIAPTTWDAEVIASGLPPTRGDIDRIRRTAMRYEIDLDVEPGPTTFGLSAYLQALLQNGYEVALAALYAAARVYHHAWSSVRANASWSSPYWPFVETWSSDVFARWIGGIERLVDAVAPDGPTGAMFQVFDRVVRFELLFWTALYHGETW
jgi:thiaminase (transcriptional activator TenA)